MKQTNRKIFYGAIIAGVLALAVTNRSCKKEESQNNLPERTELQNVFNYLDNNQFHKETVLNYILDKEESFSPRTYRNFSRLTKKGIETYPEELKWDAIEITRLTLGSEANRAIFYELDTSDYLSIADGYLRNNASYHAEKTMGVLNGTLQKIDDITNSESFQKLDERLRNDLESFRTTVRELIFGRKDENEKGS